MSVIIMTALISIMTYRFGKELYKIIKNYKCGQYLYGEKFHSIQHIRIIIYKLIFGIGLYIIFIDHSFHYDYVMTGHLTTLYILSIFYYIGNITLFISHLEDEREIKNLKR